MKKTILIAIISALTATGAAFGQPTKSITFSGPTVWTPGTTVSMDVFLTHAGYDAFAIAYWLEVQNALAPHVAITDIQFFTFPNHGFPQYPILFNSTSGASDGYLAAEFNLGGSVSTPAPVPPGNHLLAIITFLLDASAPSGSFMMHTTTETPKTSFVLEVPPNSSQNPVFPPGVFVINVVPEPSTFALLSFAVVGAGVLTYGRRNR